MPEIDLVGAKDVYLKNGEEVVDFAEGREVGFEFEDGTFKRGDDNAVYYENDWKHLVENNGPFAYHVSCARYKTTNYIEDYREAFDIVLDVDGESLEESKEATVKIVGELEDYNVPFLVKFSGNRGFHVFVPSDRGREFAKKVITVFHHLTDKIDTGLYHRRKLFRGLFSVHHESGLISVPVKPEGVPNFEKAEAEPRRVLDREWDLREFWREGSLGELADFMKDLTLEQEGTKEPTDYRGKIGWIEKLLESSVEDGRRRLIWLVIAPYLKTMAGLGNREAEAKIEEWLERCSGDPVPESYVRQQIRNAKRAGEGGLMPLSFGKMEEKYPELYEIVKEVVRP